MRYLILLFLLSMAITAQSQHSKVPTLKGLWVQEDYVRHLVKHKSPAAAYKLFDQGAADLNINDSTGIPFVINASTGNKMGGFLWEVTGYDQASSQFIATGRTGWSSEAVPFRLQWSVVSKDTLLTQIDARGAVLRKYIKLSSAIFQDPYQWIINHLLWEGQYEGLGPDGAVRYPSIRVNSHLQTKGFGPYPSFVLETDFSPPNSLRNKISFENGETFEYEFRGDYVYFYLPLDHNDNILQKGNLLFIWKKR
ncbi:MAG: hypothetical protein K1X47_06575 [Cyclobacteriaceae bacterium]|nr:hypothetical protein [Cyclobacteriaceae bacterium]